MQEDRSQNPTLPKPDWLRVRVGCGQGTARLTRLVHSLGLHTVCEEALCPNKGRCWEHGRATLMILGGTCTRACTFCNVRPQSPGPPDMDEPERVAKAVHAMGLRDAVITSVTRDDLEDGGAAIWAETVHAVRRAVPGIVLELLVPDFGGSRPALEQVLRARPDVLGHNLETVPELYAAVRPQADYERSLEVLRAAREHGLIAKTGLMLGLGETREAVLRVMRDARRTNCEILYLGQYLQPTRQHAPVRRYVHPDEFEDLRREALRMGYPVVVSAPLVRSSFHSEEQEAFVTARLKK